MNKTVRAFSLASNVLDDRTSFDAEISIAVGGGKTKSEMRIGGTLTGFILAAYSILEAATAHDADMSMDELIAALDIFKEIIADSKTQMIKEDLGHDTEKIIP